MRRRGVVALTIALVLAGGLAWAASSPAPAPSLLDDVRVLSAPEMEGRESGTAGAERSARYIIDALRAAGIRPGGPAGSYRAPFPVPTSVRLAEGASLALAADPPRTFALGTDWTPAGGSADGVVEGEVVFVGYGISEPDLGYDDYARVDVRGRIVLALAGEPRRDDPSTPFTRTYTASYGRQLYKARVARDHGARALLYVPRPHGGADTLPPLRDSRGGGELVSAAITRATAEALLAAGGLRLGELRERIESTLASASLALPGIRVRIAVRLEREAGSGVNVVGILPGTDPGLAQEAVLVGAHYDHLGRGGNGSLDAERTAIHPGADDNASGTAGVLALARHFAVRGGTPRTLVFVLFAGEEMGLLGAGAYVRDPAFPLVRTVAMVNLDMVGRMRDRRLVVGGLDSGRGLDAVMRAAAEGLDLDLAEGRSPYTPSDHLTLYQHGVPVLFLHTGVHEDYHRTTDTWEKINAEGMERVVTLAARMIDRLARDPAPAYVKLEESRPQSPAGFAHPGAGTTYFGITHDGADDTPGVRLAMVQPGSPADRAGVRPGDVVVRFDGVRVYTLEDLREVVVRRRPGDTVAVVYLREGVEHSTQVTLGARP
jgi:hypothetical protein